MKISFRVKESSFLHNFDYFHRNDHLSVAQILKKCSLFYIRPCRTLEPYFLKIYTSYYEVIVVGFVGVESHGG